jgi:RNA polymerase sigma-70 factor (ECF subfamily)
VSEDANPESALVLSEAGRQVKRALDELAEPYKTVVVLREIQGMTYEKVSQALEMPLNTVKVYLHRGRRKLREALRARP